MEVEIKNRLNILTVMMSSNQYLKSCHFKIEVFLLVVTESTVIYFFELPNTNQQS